MKFDQLYKLMINEANEIEDADELAAFSAEPPEAPEIEDVDPSTMSDSQKVDYLMNNSELWNKDGLPPSKLQVHANVIAQNGELFKMLFDKIESKKTPVQTLGPDDLDATDTMMDDELPPEADTSDVDAELGDIGDTDAGPEIDAEELNR